LTSETIFTTPPTKIFMATGFEPRMSRVEKKVGSEFWSVSGFSSDRVLVAKNPDFEKPVSPV